MGVSLSSLTVPALSCSPDADVASFVATTVAALRAGTGLNTFALPTEAEPPKQRHQVSDVCREHLTPKSRLAASGEEVSAAGVNGDAELGVLPLSEVLPIKGAEPMTFPAEVQQYIVIAGGVRAGSRLAAARDSMKYVTGPAALAVIKAKGMEK